MSAYSLSILFFILLIQLPASPIQAQPDSRASEIFDEVERRNKAIKTEQSQLLMEIYDSKNRKRTRDISSYTFSDGDIQKSLLFFEKPANIKGTGFLTISEGNSRSQKLYLPALGRVQTITSSQRSERFMGSDFTYEDLGNRDGDDYTLSMVSEGNTIAILKAEKNEPSDYAYMHFHINLKDYTLREVEYFDALGKRIRRLVAENFEELSKDIFRASKMTMYDEVESRRTEIEWLNRQLNVDIPDWRFTERALQRGS